MGILSPVLAEKSSIVSREVKARLLPVPNTVSHEEQVVIAAPLKPDWRDYPKTIQQWKVEDAEWSAMKLAVLPGLRKQFSVKIQPTVIGGVKAFILTPKNIAPENKNRLLVNVHGGGYVFGSGESSLIPFAAWGTQPVIKAFAYCIYSIPDWSSVNLHEI